MHNGRGRTVRHNQAILLLCTLSGLISVAVILYLGTRGNRP